MTRAVLWVVPLVAVLAAQVAGGDGSALASAAVLGLLAALGLWGVSAARTRRFARRVNAWVGDDARPELTATGGRQWRELATAVHALATQLRGTREQLVSTVPWSQRLVASLEEPAFVFGPERRLQAANDAGRRFTNHEDAGEALTPLQTLGSAPMADAVTEAADSGHIVALTADRAGRELRVTASPLDDHVLVVISDRTRERQVEELRRDFVVNASHELKTPVTAIRLLVEAVRVAPEERRTALLDRLDEESQRLSQLVHDLLDLRQLDETSVRERVAVDLAELVRAAVAAVARTAERSRIRLECELPDAAVVAGERRELALVVDNLVTNAVQYNREDGEVHVEIAARDGLQVLTVRDTGIGIPSNAVDRIFERFYRVDVARSRQRGGTGLGLSIVRHAVERHGGRIEVESLLGVGTTFTVWLPVEPPA